MTVNNTTSSFNTASFFTLFTCNKRPSLGLPTSPINHSFLQSPLWNNKLPQQKKKKQQIQQAIYVLPKSPSNVSIYLQLPAFRSLSVLMRCGHVSRLVENWLCNPMEQLRRAASKQSNIMSASDKEEEDTGTLSVVNNNSLVPYHSNTLFIHFQTGQQQSEPMKIHYNSIPCLFTIVCVTYHCGSVSISINQIESLDFLSLNKMNPFLVKCDLKPNHPVTIHQLTPHVVPPICDYAANNSTIETIEKDPLVIRHHSEPLPYILQDMYLNKNNELEVVVQLMHMKESILYEEEDDDDDESSSEEYSILDDLDTEEEEEEDTLLRLVQDTLEYIQSSGGAFTEELNNLQYKLYNYNRTHSVYN